MAERIVGVGELNLYIKELMAVDPLLTDIWVKGELSNYKAHSSGHHYFSLKDDVGAIKGVMFKSSAMKLKFKPQSGMSVIVHGRVSVYERDGQYQIYAQEMIPDGVGAAQLAFEQLKQELFEKGYLAESRKKPLPIFPKIVGVVTSPTGAAWQDIQKVSFSRFKGTHLLLYPASVQGELAPREIAEAIRLANIDNRADVLIVGRGGGSVEDLWCFNSREVAMAIVESKIPVVSAVGHEIDVTIADYVADKRAATPSAGAEMVVPSAEKVKVYLGHCGTRLDKLANAYLQLGKDLINRIEKKEVLNNPKSWLDSYQLLLDQYADSLEMSMNNELSRANEKLGLMARSLELLNPVSIMARGYSATFDSNGKAIVDANSVKSGEQIVTNVYNGKIYSQVVKTEQEN